jgi:hypothetical protein
LISICDVPVNRIGANAWGAAVLDFRSILQLMGVGQGLIRWLSKIEEPLQNFEISYIFAEKISASFPEPLIRGSIRCDSISGSVIS